MSNRVAVTKNTVIGGASFSENINFEEDRVSVIDKVLAAAKAGTITSSVITCATGHGVTTSDKLDVYWDGGRRVNCTVGAQTSTTITLSSGTGDSLPTGGTAVTFQIPIDVAFTLAGIGGGGTLDVFCTYMAGIGNLRFHDSGSGVLDIYFPKANTTYDWYTDKPPGTSNPFAVASLTPTGVKISNSVTSIQRVRIGFAFV
jgi:hypothetical protein